MKNYEITISPNYVNNWGVKEAIREILQNAIDGENAGYQKNINYENGVLSISNLGASLNAKDLILGCSSKEEQSGMVGKYGEGFKLALIVLLRKGYNIKIFNKDKVWTPSFKISSVFNTQVLNIEEDEWDGDSLTFEISYIDESLFESLKEFFPCIEDDFGEVINCENGQILIDKRFKGKMFVEGLYIQTDDNFAYGYNFNSDVVKLDRDRKAINYYELRALTAASIITAEECHKKIFDAIGNSCVDVRDIEEVLDDASESFLREYRDMFYEENNLEEDTLVATESVMRQLEQMDLDVPVVKGTEIQSYLIAKANDKIGLIEKAKECVQLRDDRIDNFYNLEHSNWRELMEWYMKNKHYLPKKIQKSFEDISYRMRPSCMTDYNFKTLIPDDFDYSIASIEKIKEEYEKQS